jgi:hypothetical protein
MELGSEGRKHKSSNAGLLKTTEPFLRRMICRMFLKLVVKQYELSEEISSPNANLLMRRDIVK